MVARIFAMMAAASTAKTARSENETLLMLLSMPCCLASAMPRVAAVDFMAHDVSVFHFCKKRAKAFSKLSDGTGIVLRGRIPECAFEIPSREPDGVFHS